MPTANKNCVHYGIRLKIKVQINWDSYIFTKHPAIRLLILILQRQLLIYNIEIVRTYLPRADLSYMPLLKAASKKMSN